MKQRVSAVLGGTTLVLTTNENEQEHEASVCSTLQVARQKLISVDFRGTALVLTRNGNKKRA